jgi:hypothetical protein
MRNKEEQIFDISSVYWKSLEGGKVYYSGLNQIGKEFDVIKFLINKGLSSTHAHKIINKFKELKEKK